VFSGHGSRLLQWAPPSAEYRKPRTELMPNIASAKKNLRKSRAAEIRNRAQRSQLRTALKKAKSAEASDEVRRVAAQLLDRAARKGLIHRNTAARHKSALARAGR
jgi:small subunit ribosomal protein S20